MTCGLDRGWRAAGLCALALLLPAALRAQAAPAAPAPSSNAAAFAAPALENAERVEHAAAAPASASSPAASSPTSSSGASAARVSVPAEPAQPAAAPRSLPVPLSAAAASPRAGATAPPSLQLSAADVADSKQAQLEQELALVHEQRARSTRLWPWLMIGAGAAAVLSAVTVATVESLGCAHECSTPAWTELAVVAGAGVGSIGAVWLVRVDHSRHQLELHELYLRDELERLRFGRARRELAPACAGAVSLLRLRF